ncbi:uncharacterized protein BJ212DRAFT_1297333 [Suillus subaureus]|uniref:Uncharacterized protein n=1 Tax=Suillus subaureus TaxID=48587 RepID=A0A9P7EG70_9AGAM|nr:uncharacterized protein BJ212DRAFT_1297333 [Suillus subaureus]KAG1820830.1 hypothetical protein BJ212DRAFT_1297333 [Suillus subaureus]
MPHSRNASDTSDLSETISELGSVIGFNGNVYMTMKNARISTVTYAEQTRQIIEKDKWIKPPPSVHGVDPSRVLDTMLRNIHETGGDWAICVCVETCDQVNLAKTWFMYLLWLLAFGVDFNKLIDETIMGMSEDTIQNMERLVDDLSNDMMLEHNIHDNFDKLKVYFEQTELLQWRTTSLVVPVTEESARRAKIDRNGYCLLFKRAIDSTPLQQCITKYSTLFIYSNENGGTQAITQYEPPLLLLDSSSVGTESQRKYGAMALKVEDGRMNLEKKKE